MKTSKPELLFGEYKKKEKYIAIEWRFRDSQMSDAASQRQRHRFTRLIGKINF